VTPEPLDRLVHSVAQDRQGKLDRKETKVKLEAVVFREVLVVPVVLGPLDQMA